MELKQFFTYLLVMAGSTYLIRAIPFALMKKKIQNTFVRSFLHYIPYTVLTAMTFPAALYATNNLWAATAGLLVAVFVAVRGKSLTVVAACACASVLIVELLLMQLGQ